MQRRRLCLSAVRSSRVTGAITTAALFFFLAAPAWGQCDLRQIAGNAWKDGFFGVDKLGNSRAVAVSPDGAHAYVAAFGDNAITVFSISGSEGDLTIAQTLSHPTTSGLQSPTAIAISDDGAFVYVAAFASDSITVFERETDSGSGNFGKLTFVETNLNNQGGLVRLNGPTGIDITDDGAFLVAVAGPNDSIVLFDRDALDGTLEYAHCRQINEGPGPLPTALDNPQDVDTFGAHAYVASEVGDSVTVFNIDAVNGLLGNNQTVVSTLLNGASAIEVSPDGANVYVAAKVDDRIAVLNRDSGTGQLTLGTSAAGAFNAPLGVTVSPDATRVYATGNNSDNLTVFQRNVTTGALTYKETLVDGDALPGGGAADGLGGAYAPAVSPDNAHIYVVANGPDHSVAWFEAYEPITVSCNDSNVCTNPDHCDGAGGCTGEPLPDTTTCNDNNVCTVSDHCDGSGACIGGAAAPDTTACEDGAQCTINDHCDGAGACVAGTCNVSAACGCGGTCVDTPACGCVE